MPSLTSSSVRLLAFVLIATTTANAQAGDRPPPRRSPPTAEARQASCVAVRSEHAEAFANARFAKVRKRLVAKLIAKAVGMEPSAHHYALLDESRLLLLMGGNVLPACDVAATLSRSYQIDGLKLEAETVSALSGTYRARAHRVEIAMQRLAILKRATEAGRTELALALTREATLATRNNGPMPPDYGDLERAALAAAFRSVARHRAAEPAIKVLATDDADASANAEYGTYLCFVAERWSAGITHLAKGGTSQLAAAARLDQLGADSVAGRNKIADSWWRVAADQPDRGRAARFRAADWYAQIPNSEGTRSARGSARIAQVRKELADTVRMLGLAVDSPAATRLQEVVVELYAENYPTLVPSAVASAILGESRPVLDDPPGVDWGEVVIGDASLSRDEQQTVAKKMRVLLTQKIPGALAYGDVTIVNVLGMWVANIPTPVRSKSLIPIQRSSGPVVLSVEPGFDKSTLATQAPPIGSVLWMAGDVQISSLREFVTGVVATADEARRPRPMVRLVYTYPVRRATMTDHVYVTKRGIENVRKTMQRFEW